MTLKKVTRILDWLIEQQTNRAKDFVDPAKPWNRDFDCMKDLAKSLSDSIQHEVEALQIIRKEIIPKCSHPKKMQDMDSKGNQYCMNCNMDL